MKITSILFLFATAFGFNLQAASNLVKTDTIEISNASFVDADFTNMYGGIAGTCASTNGSSTCNSCEGDKTSLEACNQKSVYPTLPVTISFKSSSDVTTAAIAKLYISDSSSSDVDVLTLAAQTYTANSTKATFSTTWAKLCSATTLGSSCAGSTGIYTGKISFGIDSDNNGDVDKTSEVKSIIFKIHYIAPGDLSTSNTVCTGTATPGFCKIEFQPGDEKVYIKGPPEGDPPKSGGIDTYANAIEFDAIAIFPVLPTSPTAGAAAITGFKTNQASPIFREVEADGTIPNSEVTGSLTNYTTYCFVYGNRNKAQNIYRFVAGSAAAADATTIATQICTAPSEVVGLLEDKHCFISTAAFGSDMANEVQTFRQFRNQFLLTNSFGKSFVKAYYKFSPPLANLISQSEVLRSITRAALYPILGFSYLAIHYGFLAALLTLMVLLILVLKIKSVVKQKRLLLVLFILILTPALKAQIEPKTATIHHSEADNGLVRITSDGTYIYDIKREMRHQSSRITFGHALQPEVSIDIERRDPNTGNGTGQFQTFNFGDLYKETSSFIIGYDYEWFPWITKGGKLGLQAGTALMYASGHGKLLSTLDTSREEFTFFTVPITAGAVYRLEWKDRQWVAPYVAGGGTYTALFEKREDKSTPQATGAPGFYAAGGILVNLGMIDEDSGYALDSEYGVSNLWLTVEFKVIEVNAETFTFSNQYLNAGVAFDF